MTCKKRYKHLLIYLHFLLSNSVKNTKSACLVSCDMLRWLVIVNFRHRGLKRLYEKGDGSKIRPDMLRKVSSALARLDVLADLDELRVPGYNLHPLTGDLNGFWSITVSRNHRIIFRFEDGYVYDVALTDYH